MIELYLKSAAILAAASVLAFLLRRHSAAARHLVWLGAIAAILILPLGLLMPRAAVPIPGAVSIVASSIAPGVTESTPFTLFSLWLAVAVILGIRLCVGVVRTLFIIDRSAPASSSTLRFTRDLPVPAAWGLGRKLILLPEQSQTWAAERRAAVLLHEQAHLRRHDCWALLMAEIACVVYWCNPLVWFAASRLRLEQERAADDEVLHSGFDAAQYAGHLVAIAKADRAPMLAAGAVHTSQLGVRVQSILDPGRDRTMASRKTIGIAAALLLAISLPIASMQAERKIYKIGDDGVTAPKVIHKPEPSYTPEAREAKIEGRVLLSGVLDIDGKLHEVEVKESLDAGLDQKAVEAIGTWRFEPARKAGEPVPVAVNIEVNFRLL